MSRGTSANAARYTSMENAVPRHVLARMIATKGKEYSQSGPSIPTMPTIWFRVPSRLK